MTLYRDDDQPTLHRGAICKFVPVCWLPHPLWLVRDPWEDHSARYARLLRYGDYAAKAAFSQPHESHEEDVIARAKLRFVVILSDDAEAQRPGFRDLIVVPAYTIHAEWPAQRVAKIRTNSYFHLFYLLADPAYPEVGECFLDFRAVTSLDKGFLRDAKLPFACTDAVTKALLVRYLRYLGRDYIHS